MDASSTDTSFLHNSQVNGPTPREAVVPNPLFVYLEGACVVVIGAGDVAQRKIATLLEYGASVHVIAPEATKQVQAWANQGIIAFEQRPYTKGDLQGALLVVGATNNREVNEAVYEEAMQRTMLVNIVDVPELCNTIIPSILRRGKLQIAVSTAGAAPSVARDIRRSLEEQYPEHWERYIDLLGEVRALIKQRIPGPASVRMPLYERLGTVGLEQRLAAGQNISAEEAYEQYVQPFIEGGAQ